MVGQSIPQQTQTFNSGDDPTTPGASPSSVLAALRMGVTAGRIAAEAGVTEALLSLVVTGRRRATARVTTAADRLLRRTLEERLALLILELVRGERA